MRIIIPMWQICFPVNMLPLTINLKELKFIYIFSVWSVQSKSIQLINTTTWFRSELEDQVRNHKVAFALDSSKAVSSRHVDHVPELIEFVTSPVWQIWMWIFFLDIVTADMQLPFIMYVDGDSRTYSWFKYTHNQALLIHHKIHDDAPPIFWAHRNSSESKWRYRFFWNHELWFHCFVHYICHTMCVTVVIKKTKIHLKPWSQIFSIFLTSSVCLIYYAVDAAPHWSHIHWIPKEMISWMKKISILTICIIIYWLSGKNKKKSPFLYALFMNNASLLCVWMHSIQ